ncbi:hypothetical protein IPO96_03950 [Candidatus Saccharibacteria bacterium]|jgi:hypothetical protein|nr:MAG: hypothetical protein IPO96_03950 [Candidatus Saccharibacteria bacterium]
MNTPECIKEITEQALRRQVIKEAVNGAIAETPRTLSGGVNRSKFMGAQVSRYISFDRVTPV